MLLVLEIRIYLSWMTSRHFFHALHLGGERHKESIKVSYLRTQHNVLSESFNPRSLIQDLGKHI